MIGSAPTQQFAGVGRIEAGDQAQERGFAAAARADERDQFAGADGERDVVRARSDAPRIVRREESSC